MARLAEVWFSQLAPCCRNFLPELCPSGLGIFSHALKRPCVMGMRWCCWTLLRSWFFLNNYVTLQLLIFCDLAPLFLSVHAFGRPDLRSRRSMSSGPEDKLRPSPQLDKAFICIKLSCPYKCSLYLSPPSALFFPPFIRVRHSQ